MHHIGTDKIVKQSCYIAKIYDGGFKNKHIGVNLFSLQLCLHEYMLKILCKKEHNLFQDAGGTS